MFCTGCSAELVEPAAFCHVCGKPAVGTSSRLNQGRVEGHLRLLGILWLALSGLRLLPGLILVVLSGGTQFLPADIPFFVPGILALIGGVLSITAIAGIVAGWGLLAREPWARTFAIVVGAISLMDLPFGTALGIYTLWVLVPGNAEQEYQRVTSPGAHVAG